MLNSRQFTAIYNEYLESGLTVRGYCANHQITESKFFYWQNKLKSQLPQKGFVPVIFDDAQPPRTLQSHPPVQNRAKSFSNPATLSQVVSCEISYPNGVCLKLNGVTDPVLLRSLLLLSQR
jgi:predicted ABC-class ATPase